MAKALLLGGVSLLALSGASLAAELSPGGGAPWVLDTAGTTTFSSDNESAENAWIGLDTPGVILALDASLNPVTLTIAPAKSFHLGINASANGGATVLTGASPLNTASLVVGDQVFIGEGSDGNALTLNAYSTVTASSLVLGVNAGSSDNLVELLTGTSSVELTSNLIVGNSGSDNEVTLANGASLDADGQVILGLNAGASGNSLTLSSGSTITADLGTLVGGSGGGNAILVQSGADFTTNTTTLGSAVGSDNNRFTVTGVGSTFTGLHAPPGASFNVGDGGKQNSLTVADGAVFSIGDRLALGKTVGSTDNSVFLYGAGSEIHAGNVRIGINTVGSSGNELNIYDHGHIVVTNDIKVYGGNSIDLSSGAELDMAGFNLYSGATFQLDVDAANAINFDVTGAAILNGTLELGYSGGALSKRYLVLSSGGLTNGLTLDQTGFASGFTAALDVEGNDLYLKISGTLGLGSDLGDNQQNIVDAVNDAFDSGNPLAGDFAALYGVDPDNLNSWLSVLTGEVNAFMQTEAGWSGTEAALGRLTGDGACRPATVGATCVSPYISGGAAELSGNADLGTTDTRLGTAQVGTGWATLLASDTTLSGLLVLDQSSVDLGDLGTGQSSALRVGFGLRQEWQGFYASAGGSLGLGLASTDRALGYKDSVFTSSEFVQALFGLRGEVGATIDLGSGASLSPFAAVQWANNANSGFTESITGDHPDLALSYGDAQQARTALEMGLRFALAPQASDLTLSGELAYQHVLAADEAVSTTLVGMPDNPFDITPATAPSDRLSLGIEASLALGTDTRLGLGLDGSLGEGYQSLGSKLTLTHSW